MQERSSPLACTGPRGITTWGAQDTLNDATLPNIQFHDDLYKCLLVNRRWCSEAKIKQRQYFSLSSSHLTLEMCHMFRYQTWTWYLLQVLGSMTTLDQMELKVLIVCAKINIYQADLCCQTTCLLLSAVVTHSGWTMAVNHVSQSFPLCGDWETFTVIMMMMAGTLRFYISHSKICLLWEHAIDFSSATLAVFGAYSTAPFIQCICETTIFLRIFLHRTRHWRVMGDASTCPSYISTHIICLQTPCAIVLHLQTLWGLLKLWSQTMLEVTVLHHWHTLSSLKEKSSVKLNESNNLQSIKLVKAVCFVIQ